MNEPLFAGLVYAESGEQLPTTVIGGEGCYVFNDAGFLRHIPSRPVDEAILRSFWELMRGHEREIAELGARLTGQEDIFSRAVLQHSLEHPETQQDAIFRQGIPEDTRLWMGMMGFRATVNLHGDLVRVELPSREPDEGEN